MPNLQDEICGNCGKTKNTVDPYGCVGFKSTGRYKDMIMSNFEVKDSGKREQFAGGMVRDVTEGKIDYMLALDGPMFKRWAEHLTKGAKKYAKRNWMRAKGQAELDHAMESLGHHFIQYIEGEIDEDHAAAIYFNINLIEYIKEKLKFRVTSSEASADLRQTWVPGMVIRTVDKDNY